MLGTKRSVIKRIFNDTFPQSFFSMKLIFLLFFLSICAMAASQALNYNQIAASKPAFAGMQPGEFFRSIPLQSEAQKLLTNPDLSDDLRLRVLDSMANAEKGFTDCSAPGSPFWMQIRCSALRMAVTKKELKAIENELTAKAAAATNASASENQ